MLQRFTSPKSKYGRILYGNDTDVSDCMITKYTDNLFLCVSVMIDEEDEKISPVTYVWTLEEFKKHFDLQYGAPMMYISREDFEWITEPLKNLRDA